MTRNYEKEYANIIARQNKKQGEQPETKQEGKWLKQVEHQLVTAKMLLIWTTTL
tara:strand:- start:350 stop:511 length:162 start_codon:yes stop_codon:yes gene_type:complete